MTRINVGIEPHELCDQHLVAEYRELPRMWNFVPKSPAPKTFTLNKGHMLWCSQYKGMLYERYGEIVQEMKDRGMNVSFPTAPKKYKNGCYPSQKEIKRARKLLQERIASRLQTMKTKPRWTKAR